MLNVARGLMAGVGVSALVSELFSTRGDVVWLGIGGFVVGLLAGLVAEHVVTISLGWIPRPLKEHLPFRWAS